MHNDNEHDDEDDDDFGMEVFYTGSYADIENIEEDEDEGESDFIEEEQVISKSQKKRDHHALLKLAEHALTLTDDKLRQTGLDEPILKAFFEAKKMRASGARNRQLKYITKLLTHADSTELEGFLDKADQSRESEKQHFHQLEHLRNKLLEQGDQAMQEVIDLYPHADRQQLRNLIRQAQKETAQNKAPAAARKIFKYLRTLSES